MSAPARIVVTGALGFVGTRLVPRLNERGAHVIAVVRPGREDAARVSGAAEIRAADLLDPLAAAAAFAGADAIVHLSGIAQAAALVPGLERAGPTRGVFLGSAGVNTRFASASADAKRRGEAALRGSRLDYTILRPTMIYGAPGDRNFERLIRWLRAFPAIPLAGGATPQQPVHVDDLVDAILAALDCPAAVRGEYDLAGPEPVTLREVVEMTGRILGRRPVVLPVSIGLARAAVAALAGLGVRAPLRAEQILRLGESKAVDIEAARADLAFHPRGLAAGIESEARLLAAR